LLGMLAFPESTATQVFSPCAGVQTGRTAQSDEDDQGSGSGEALGEFAAESLGQGLGAARGFGIANRILGEIGHADVQQVISGGRAGNQKRNP